MSRELVLHRGLENWYLLQIGQAMNRKSDLQVDKGLGVVINGTPHSKGSTISFLVSVLVLSGECFQGHYQQLAKSPDLS